MSTTIFKKGDVVRYTDGDSFYGGISTRTIGYVEAEGAIVNYVGGGWDHSENLELAVETPEDLPSIVGCPEFIVEAVPMSIAGLQKQWDVYMVCTVGYDAKGRFPMGSQIRTSRVDSAEYDEGTNMTVVKTRNSTYHLIGNPLRPLLNQNASSGSGIGATFHYEDDKNEVRKLRYLGGKF